MKKMRKEWMNMQNEHDLNTKSAIAFGGTFAFFTNAKAKQKNAKEPPSQRTTTRQTMDRNTTTERRPACNTGLAKVAVQCSADTFVVNQSLVLRINICGENRHLRQARKR